MTSTIEQLVVSFIFSLEAGNWKHLVQGLRVFSELASSRLISKISFLDFLSQATDFALCKSQNGQVSCYLAWAILSALPYASKVGKEDPTFSLIWERLSGWVKTTAPHSKDLAILIELNAEFACKEWNIWPQSEVDVDLNLSLEPVDWSIVTVERSWNPHYEHLTIFEDTFDLSISNLKFVKWQVVFDLRQLSENFELNHRKLAEILLISAPETIGHPEKIVCEFLFGQLLAARPEGLSPICHQLLLMNCCRLASLFPPIMAKSLFALVNRLDEFGLVKTSRLAKWFALHLSNFDFKWKWTEWENILTLPKSSLKLVFIKMVFENLVRLSYYDRIVEIVPEWARALIPPSPEPLFRFDSQEGSKRLLAAMQDKTTFEKIEEILQELSPSEARDLFVQSLLKAGSKTLSHVVILIERYLPLLQKLHPKDDLAAKLETIQNVSDFWAASSQHFQFIIERLIHYRILSAPSVLQWIFQSTESRLAAGDTLGQVVFGCFSYELIVATLLQAQNFPHIVKQKIEETDDQDRVAKLELSLKSVQNDWYHSVNLVIEGLVTLPTMAFPSALEGSATSAACANYLDSLLQIFMDPIVRQVTDEYVASHHLLDPIIRSILTQA